MTASTLLSIRSAELKQKKFARRTLLPHGRDYFWKIESGVVRTLTWLEDGTTVTLGLWGVGDIVSPMLSKTDPYHMECLTPVQATILPLDRCQQITEGLILHSQQLHEFLEILHCRAVDTSLLRLLNWLAKKFGHQVKQGQGQLIDLRLTHQEIAEAIGTTRVTVTRLLNEFEKQGIIERLPRKFIVLNEKQPFWHYEI